MPYYRPRPVSEREAASTWVDGRTPDDGHWEDCAPCSIVMLVAATSGGKQPPTANLEEAERLRLAAGYGPLGGTDIARLGPVAAKRYGIVAPHLVTGAAAIWTALSAGKGAAIAGMMSAFPAGHRLRRWDPGFAGGHAVYVQREDASDRVWWIDPLAPIGTYKGEWVTKAELLAFFSKGLASAEVASVALLPEPAPAPAAPKSWKIYVAADAEVRLAKVAANGTIVGWESRRWGPKASSASCEAPVAKKLANGVAVQVAKATAGAFKGRYVALASGVTARAV